MDASGSALLADLAYMETPTLKPAIVMVFGGRWRANSRLDNNGGWERLSKWAADGFFTMTIDHRLVETTSAPAMPAIVDLHSHVGYEDVTKATERKENYTRENLLDHLDRCAYTGHPLKARLGSERVKTVDLTRLGLAVPIVDEVAGAALDLWAASASIRRSSSTSWACD
jgi:hypothetical protein